MIRRGPRPMRGGAAILGLAIVLTGCASPEITPEERQALLRQPDLTPEQRREILAGTTGTILGTVREASTKRPVEGVFMTTIFRVGADSDTLTDATGNVHNRNEVFIALIPRVSHGGLSLTGTIEGDEVRGTWTIRGLGNVKGDFLMLRKDT